DPREDGRARGGAGVPVPDDVGLLEVEKGRANGIENLEAGDRPEIGRSHQARDTRPHFAADRRRRFGPIGRALGGWPRRGGKAYDDERGDLEQRDRDEEQVDGTEPLREERRDAGTRNGTKGTANADEAEEPLRLLA